MKKLKHFNIYMEKSYVKLFTSMHNIINVLLIILVWACMLYIEMYLINKLILHINYYLIYILSFD